MVKFLELCIKIDAEFIKLREKAEVLTPFLNAFRYPQAEAYPEKQVLEDAIVKAKPILKFVKEKIT